MDQNGGWSRIPITLGIVTGDGAPYTQSLPGKPATEFKVLAAVEGSCMIARVMVAGSRAKLLQPLKNSSSDIAAVRQNTERSF
jgi:hypothetical protein